MGLHLVVFAWTNKSDNSQQMVRSGKELAGSVPLLVGKDQTQMVRARL